MKEMPPLPGDTILVAEVDELRAEAAHSEPWRTAKWSVWQQMSDAATPGPWHQYAVTGAYVKAGNGTVADCRYKNGKADAALIVAAVNYIRAALATPSEVKEPVYEPEQCFDHVYSWEESGGVCKDCGHPYRSTCHGTFR